MEETAAAEICSGTRRDGWAAATNSTVGEVMAARAMAVADTSRSLF
jgi:hypothetical protein